MYDMDYELYKYIDELADRYVEFDELLKRNHLTLTEAQQPGGAVQRRILFTACKIFYPKSESCCNLL